MTMDDPLIMDEPVTHGAGRQPYVLGAIACLVLLALQAWQTQWPPQFVPLPDYTLFGGLLLKQQLVRTGIEAWLSAGLVAFVTAHRMFEHRQVQGFAFPWRASACFAVVQMLLQISVPWLFNLTGISHFALSGGMVLSQLAFLLQQVVIAWFAVHVVLRIFRSHVQVAVARPARLFRARDSIIFASLTMLCLLFVWPTITSLMFMELAYDPSGPERLGLQRGLVFAGSVGICFVAGAGAWHARRRPLRRRPGPWGQLGIVLLAIFVTFVLSQVVVFVLNRVLPYHGFADADRGVALVLGLWALTCLAVFGAACTMLSRRLLSRST